MNAGAPTPDINGANYYGLAPSQCFEGTSFSRFSLSQNVRLFGGSNQGWMKVDDRLCFLSLTTFGVSPSLKA
jgi:hypothetical protein